MVFDADFVGLRVGFAGLGLGDGFAWTADFVWVWGCAEGVTEGEDSPAWGGVDRQPDNRTLKTTSKRENFKKLGKKRPVFCLRFGKDRLYQLGLSIEGADFELKEGLSIIVPLTTLWNCCFRVSIAVAISAMGIDVDFDEVMDEVHLAKTETLS